MGIIIYKTRLAKVPFQDKVAGCHRNGSFIESVLASRNTEQKNTKKIVLRHISFSSSFDSIECLNIVAVWKLN